MSGIRSSRGTILVVDDEEINREILVNLFSELFEIEQASDGGEAFRMLWGNADAYAAVLLDINMPVLDGLELLRRLQPTGFLSSTPVFLVTAEGGSRPMEEAFALGVMDYIEKPFVAFAIQRRVLSVVELFEARKSLSLLVEDQRLELLERAQQINELNRGMIESLAAAIEFRDGESGGHVRRIHDLTHLILSKTRMGETFSPEDIDDIALAAIMHDVGKIAVPDSILCKPARLTPEEFEVMKGHTISGADMLGRIPQLRGTAAYGYAVDIARHHHERWDGRGYPDGLKGEEISVPAQVVGLADVYDALTSVRVYKPAFGHDKAVEMICGGECGAFGPDLIQCFLEVESLLLDARDSS